MDETALTELKTNKWAKQLQPRLKQARSDSVRDSSGEPDLGYVCTPVVDDIVTRVEEVVHMSLVSQCMKLRKLEFRPAIEIVQPWYIPYKIRE